MAKAVSITKNELSEITEHWPEGAELVSRIYAALAEHDTLRAKVRYLQSIYDNGEGDDGKESLHDWLHSDVKA